LVAKLGYSVGFLIVILGRQQLFTENTLTPILPLMLHKTARTFGNTARLWIAVLITNLIGAIAFAYVVARTSLFSNDINEALLAIGRESLSPTWGTTLLRGIFAGWLIALLVWVLPVAETGRIWTIIIITWLVGLAGFSHVIAGTIDVAYVAAHGDASLVHVLLDFTLPALIGNIIGGVSLVAALNHAQVVSGEGDPRE
jgi:formate/nitrite transporter FocA (FNT family)